MTAPLDTLTARLTRAQQARPRGWPGRPPVPGFGLEIAEWTDHMNPHALVADLLRRSHPAPTHIGGAMPKAHMLNHRPRELVALPV